LGKSYTLRVGIHAIYKYDASKMQPFQSMRRNDDSIHRIAFLW
jgi:hypothetical protein